MDGFLLLDLHKKFTSVAVLEFARVAVMEFQKKSDKGDKNFDSRDSV